MVGEDMGGEGMQTRNHTRTHGAFVRHARQAAVIHDHSHVRWNNERGLRTRKEQQHFHINDN